MTGALRNERGAALVVTLLVVAVMTVTVTEFLHSTWVERSLSADFRDETKAMAAVRSGIDAGKAAIVEDLKEDTRKGRLADHLGEYWAMGSMAVPISGSYMFVTVRDESARLNVNSLVTGRGYPNEKWQPVFRRLLRTLDLDEAIADYITDWLDADNEGAAEEVWYRSLEHPYHCKNRGIDSIEELKRIRGITPAAYARLKDFVTIKNSGWVNVNTAPEEVLMALDGEITPSLARDALKARAETPFMAKQDVKNITGWKDVYPRIHSLIDVSSNTFSVDASATFNEVTRNAHAIFTGRSGPGANLIYYRAG